MSHREVPGLMPLRGRLGSVLAAWQEMNRGINHREQNNTAVGGDSQNALDLQSI
jgi:hypothetical protein